MTIPKNNMDNEAARLHPASWHNLRALVSLHGITSLRRALDKIEQEEHAKQTIETDNEDAFADDVNGWRGKASTK